MLNENGLRNGGKGMPFTNTKESGVETLIVK